MYHGEEQNQRRSPPKGLWDKCSNCQEVLYRPDFERNLMVCPKCDHHARLSARQRLNMFLDKGEHQELMQDVQANDPLKFRDLKRYRERLQQYQKNTQEKEALLAFQGTVEKIPVVALAFEFRFSGGSMGFAVGERFTRSATLALEQRMPLVCFAASGGARMQEGVIALMQMGKTSAILQRLKNAGVPYISVLTDPVYGGVMASLASLGDINIAEPGSRAGFAGPQVIRDTIGETLPDSFQKSEFLLKHGAIDMVVHRQELRSTIARLLRKLLPSSAAA